MWGETMMTMIVVFSPLTYQLICKGEKMENSYQFPTCSRHLSSHSADMQGKKKGD
jgi:hypothetical protein